MARGQMLLQTPISAPFTLRGAGSCDLFGSASLLDARHRARADAPRAIISHSSSSRAPRAPPAVSRGRGLVVQASSSKEGAGGLPANGREAAERRRVLLKFVREVQPALIEQFVERGPPAVVAAMKNTITNMLGTLPPQFFTVTITTMGENMSQLMLSVMTTGYLFRNIQYRLELRNALGPALSHARAHPPGSAGGESSGSGGGSSQVVGSGMQRSLSAPLQGSVLDDETYAPGVQKSRVQGDVLLWHKDNGVETLEAVQYIEVLEGEVARLRQQLQQLEAAPQQQQGQQQRQRLPPPHLPQQLQPPGAPPSDARQLPVPVSGQSSLQQPAPAEPPALQSSGPAGVLALHEEAVGNELLEYLRALDTASLAELTRGAGAEVAAAMEGFVGRLMGTHDRDSLSRAGSDCTAQELARVMFWLMIVGYTLRGLEVRWDMQRAALADVSRAGEARLSADDSYEAW